MATKIAKFKFGSQTDRQAASKKLSSEFGGYGWDNDDYEYTSTYYIILYDTIKDVSLARKICQAAGGEISS